MARHLVAATALVCATWTVTGTAQGVLEIPAPNSTQTGIGIVSGWHCSANRIEIVIDGGAPLVAGSHTDREDTSTFCGRIDTGFSLLWNWNLLPTDCFGCRYHRVVALADGIPFASTEFQAENFGTEFMTGKSGEYSLPNFPEISSVRDYVQNRLLRKAEWSWYEVECRCRPKPFYRGPHHDREEA